MIMETGYCTSIAGINAFCRQMETTANNIANVNTEGYKSKKGKITEDYQKVAECTVNINKTTGIPIQGSDRDVHEFSNVDLSQETPNLLLTLRGYEASLKTLKLQTEVDKSVLDILA
jgi:flagellar basal body rod protein FlgG